MINVEQFIARIRDSFIGAQHVYTEGSCYHFYLILKEVFPDAEAYYDGSHVLTKINGKFYDITGEVEPNNGMNKFEKPASYGLKVPFNIYLKPTE